ncbi:hypothetical protein ZEAMMB73_Zm00001d044186 [Zea mays]|uniref:DM2 domain-containing protein n=1 Tax=Zea mays TaxID=4577 RepID=A0A1D6NIX9_MAIZE|nr:hypothetical protein ZEAMMB73_Zm00001d044186 [Zea mays]
MDSSAADDPMADEARVEDAFTQEITDYSYVPRYHVLSWMETVEGMVAGVAALPPVYLILNRALLRCPCQDLLETGWGWKRLVPYRPGYVEWHVFKKYLGDYFDHNREAFLCAEQKPDPFGWIIAKKSALIAAAKLLQINLHHCKNNQNAFQCLKMEKALLRYCASFLTPDDKRLILRIKDQAKQMIQSEGDQSLVVTICLEVVGAERAVVVQLVGPVRRAAARGGRSPRAEEVRREERAEAEDAAGQQVLQRGEVLVLVLEQGLGLGALHEEHIGMVLQAMVQMGVLVPTGDMTVVRRTAQFFLNSFQECLTAQRKEREMATAELGFKKQLTKEEKFEKRKQRLAAIGEDLLAIAADQPFRFPATFTFVVRAFSVLDGTGKGLDPRFHITEIAKPNAKELLRFNDAGVEIVVKASFNIWSKLLTYLYDSTSPKGVWRDMCIPPMTNSLGSMKERRAQLDSIHVKSEAAARSCFAFMWIYLANGMWIRSRGNEPCSQNNVLNFSLVSISVYLHSVGKLQPHCNKVYKRFAMRKNKFMGSNKNQAKKTDINCDATLKSLFGERDKVGMLEISKLLSRGFPKISKLLWSMEPGMALW